MKMFLFYSLHAHTCIHTQTHLRKNAYLWYMTKPAFWLLCPLYWLALMRLYINKSTLKKLYWNYWRCWRVNKISHANKTTTKGKELYEPHRVVISELFAPNLYSDLNYFENIKIRDVQSRQSTVKIPNLRRISKTQGMCVDGMLY